MDAVPASLSVALPARAEKAGTGNPTLTTGDAPDSICPYGWRLPGYSGDGSHYQLIESYISRRRNDSMPLFVPPMNFIYDGGLRNSTLTPNDFSVYWTKAVSGAHSARIFGFRMNNINQYDSDTRYFGYHIRCLAR